jgi:multiple sugar transport system substrate-binding protein
VDRHPRRAERCSLLDRVLSANLGQPIPPDGDLLRDDVFETILDTLDELIALAHPESTRRNPIQTYDAMSTGDDIVYVPFGFGYTNYSRRGAAKPVRFTTVAGPGPDPAAGAILGGAGCAVSSSCRDLDAALTYMRWLHDPAHQAGDYFRFGGQPGLRSAWTSPENDAEAGGFFSGTLDGSTKPICGPVSRASSRLRTYGPAHLPLPAGKGAAPR